MAAITEAEPHGAERPRDAEERVVNVPNLLTAARLLLAVAVVVLIEARVPTAALGVFLLAVSTDWIDGYWARRFHQITRFGRVFDPFVDKVLVCGAFIGLASQAGSFVPAWAATLVVARELLVTALRGAVEGRGGDFSARWSGKVKLAVQAVAVSTSLLGLAWPGAPAWYGAVVIAALATAVLSTLYSGAVYVVAAIRATRLPPAAPQA